MDREFGKTMLKVLGAGYAGIDNAEQVVHRECRPVDYFHRTACGRLSSGRPGRITADNPQIGR